MSMDLTAVTVGHRDTQTSVSLLCGLTYEWAENYYHAGRITQDEWEGYMHAWSHFHPDSSISAGWNFGEVYSPEVLAIAVGLVEIFTPRCDR